MSFMRALKVAIFSEKIKITTRKRGLCLPSARSLLPVYSNISYSIQYLGTKVPGGFEYKISIIFTSAMMTLKHIDRYKQFDPKLVTQCQISLEAVFYLNA